MIRKLSIVGFCLLASFSALSAQKALALVVQSTGKVEVVQGGKTTPAKVNDLLKQGDMVRTGGDGSVSVQLSGGALFRLQANTEVALSELSHDGGLKVKLDIKRGGLAAQIDKLAQKEKFQVNTPTAIAGVRGTQFIVEIAQATQAASVLVSDGSVGVASSEGGTEQVCDEGNKIVSDGKEMKLSLLEQFEKDKFKIFEVFNKVKKDNFDQLVEQIRKNREMMNQQKQGNLMDQVQPQ